MQRDGGRPVSLRGKATTLQIGHCRRLTPAVEVSLLAACGGAGSCQAAPTPAPAGAQVVHRDALARRGCFARASPVALRRVACGLCAFRSVGGVRLGVGLVGCPSLVRDR